MLSVTSVQKEIQAAAALAILSHSSRVREPPGVCSTGVTQEIVLFLDVL